MQLPDQMFTIEGLSGLSAVSALVYVFTNGVRYFFGFFRRWLFLLFSFVVLGALFGVSGVLSSAEGFIVFAGNVVLVSLTAAGVNEATTRGIKETRDEQQGAVEKVWFKSRFD